MPNYQGRPPTPALERFAVKIICDIETRCWVWQAHLYAGYGHLRVGHKKLMAHRWSYEYHVGPIAKGLEVDHVCRNRACVNPSHLRLTTPGENSQNHDGSSRRSNRSGVRGVSWVRGRWQAKVTHDGIAYHVGRFDDLREAAEAVRAKRNELFTHNDWDRRR